MPRRGPANRYHAARCYVRSGAQLRNPGSNDTQAPAHFREDFRRPLELGTLVRGGHNGAQARLAFRDRGIAHGRSIQASVEQPARELERFGSLAHMDRRYGRFASAGAEAGLLQALLEKLCIGPELLDERSEEHTSELQSLAYLVCRLLLEKKKKSTESHRTD